MSDASGFNYVGLNTAHSSSYDPVMKPSPNPTTGVGIWVNNASHGNYLFGNDLSGSPENGVDVLASNSTYLQGNSVHGNLQGGIWIANWGPAPPRDAVVHNNFVYFNTANAQVHLAGASNVDVAYNYLSGAQSPQSGTLASSNTGGVLIQDTGAPTVGSDSIVLYENSVTDVNNRVLVNPTTTNALVFRNRFLNGSNDPSAPSGRQGLTYSIAPAGVQWDASRFFGGNLLERV